MVFGGVTVVGTCLGSLLALPAGSKDHYLCSHLLDLDKGDVFQLISLEGMQKVTVEWLQIMIDQFNVSIQVREIMLEIGSKLPDRFAEF
jgi:hypothetical protein